jgi:predicted unusual protein kinase regulating ubiquinone biosynthesis (AarF/ABC1/UbiB family)
MKAGQMLAMVGEYFLPEEVSGILSRLRNKAEPVAWQTMTTVLYRNVDKARLAELEITEEAYAAASVGQVHIATRKRDGAKICLKIQYPGIDKAIDSDIETMRTLLAVARLLPTGIDFDGIIAEVRAMFRRELDYHKEFENTLEFADLLKDDPRFVVPQVYPEYSGKRVLATAFSAGVQLDKELQKTLPQSERTMIGEAMLELFFKELFVFGAVQTDPHFGNYLYDSGKVVLLDFGAVRHLTKGFRSEYRRFLSGALYCEKDQFYDAATKLGIIANGDEHLPFFYDFCRLVLEPYILPGEPDHNPKFFDTNGHYQWELSDLGDRVAAKVRQNLLLFKLRSPTPELIFFDRKASGVFLTLTAIGPRFNCRALLERYLGN